MTSATAWSGIRQRPRRSTGPPAKALAQQVLGSGVLLPGGLGEPLGRLPVVLLNTGESAGQGYARAQELLGECYENGSGVEKDERRAFELYRQSHEGGHAPGTCALGFLLHAAAVLTALPQQMLGTGVVLPGGLGEPSGRLLVVFPDADAVVEAEAQVARRTPDARRSSTGPPTCRATHPPPAPVQRFRLLQVLPYTGAVLIASSQGAGARRVAALVGLAVQLNGAVLVLLHAIALALAEVSSFFDAIQPRGGRMHLCFPGLCGTILFDIVDALEKR